jgi:hypothetical protein
MAPDIPLDPLSKPANYSMDLATRAKWIPAAPALDHAVDFIYPPYKPSDEEQHNQPNLETLDPEARKLLKSRIAQRKTRKFFLSVLRMETYYFSGHSVGEKVKAGNEHLNWAFENAPDTSYAYHATNSENLDKIDAVNDPEYAATLDQSSTSSQRAASFSSSMGSIERDDSQSKFNNSFRRWRSANCNASLGYEKVVFDASSIYSTKSQVSATSASSGRLGPLSSLTRAGMNAVIKVGACWRCRFLRKPVGAYSRREINTDW